jgi:hypothetical protein
LAADSQAIAIRFDEVVAMVRPPESPLARRFALAVVGRANVEALIRTRPQHHSAVLSEKGDRQRVMSQRDGQPASIRQVRHLTWCGHVG